MIYSAYDKILKQLCYTKKVPKHSTITNKQSHIFLSVSPDLDSTDRLFTSIGTARGQGIVRVTAVVLVPKFF